jgi:hypothetical protein
VRVDRYEMQRILIGVAQFEMTAAERDGRLVA